MHYSEAIDCFFIMVQPRIVPWAQEDELQELKDWFYNGGGREDMRFRAVQKVKSYQSKGTQYVPHVIDSTAQITSSILLDEERSACDKFSVKLSYTMSLIRFVNGLLDPTQQSQFAIPLHTLARRVGLPTWFVDLRHWGTHERELPSLEMLRMAAKKALVWLWEHYWNDDELEEEEISDDEESEIAQEVRKLARMGKSLKTILAENSQHWEEGTPSLISSSNFRVEEPRAAKRSEMSPREQIDAYVSRCREIWNRQEDRQLFVAICMEEYNSTIIRLMLMKLREFDQELVGWLFQSYQDKIRSSDTSALGKRFPQWDVLERKLLTKIASSVSLKSLAQCWDAWDDLLSRNPSYVALWLCKALANRIAEDRASFKRSKSKRRKQESLQQVETGLLAHIDNFSNRYDEEQQLYNRVSAVLTPADKVRPQTTEMADILGDLASLRQRLQSPKPPNVPWARHSQWQARPFGTL